MANPMTPRQRMIAAYRGEPVDRIPVAPEFWYYVPARLMGLSMVEFELEVPHWQALQHTFKHYGCEGWGIVGPASDACVGQEQLCLTRLDERRFEAVRTFRIGSHEICSRSIMDSHEPSWLIERYVKDWDTDWPVYENLAMPPLDSLDWRPVQSALDQVGEDYLLEVFVGFPFIDFIGNHREGSLEQVLVDLAERETEMRDLLARYCDYMARKTEMAFEKTGAVSVFVASSWSSLSLLSPRLWRQWERPVLEAVIEAARRSGGLVHHHFHGRCMAVLPELAGLGLDCICPFERPPGGDVSDVRAVRRILNERVTFNGNVHTVETLLRGTPADVAREVAEIVEAFRGSCRLIVGTGDQVAGDTPEENIRAMVETARSYGIWHTD